MKYSVPQNILDLKMNFYFEQNLDQNIFYRLSLERYKLYLVLKWNFKKRFLLTKYFWNTMPILRETGTIFTILVEILRGLRPDIFTTT